MYSEPTAATTLNLTENLLQRDSPNKSFDLQD
jgi:hypothetical protein